MGRTETRLSARGPRPLRVVAAAAVAALLVAGSSATAQESPEAAPAALLTFEGIEIEPAQPGPETLCRLRVKVRNAGDRDAASLAFTVRINGDELPVYRNQLFMQAIPAGGSDTVALYNFWTTETSRPMPADGRLRIEVLLREAQWMQIGDEEGVEVWRPLGEVAGLPSAVETTIELRRPAAGAG